MASPDIGQAQSVPQESSSLLRWLVASVLIVTLAAAAVIGVQYLPKENPNNDRDMAFPIRTKPKGPPGKIVLTEPTTHKFGVLPQQTKGSHTWVFKNGGEGVLELSKGPSTCSCTIANFKDEKSKLVLEPGQSTEITLTWETREFDGNYEKSATINVVGDLDRSQIVFAVEGTVRPAVAILPKERVLNYGDVPSDASRKLSFALASSDYPEMKIVSVTSSRPDLLNFEIKPLPDADRKAMEWSAMSGGFVVEAELKPAKDLGVFNEEILVTTDHPKIKEVRFTAGGRRSGPITIVPQAVQMHNITPSEGGQRQVMILVRGDADTKFEVSGCPENLKVEIVKADVKNGSAIKIGQYRMIVTVPPGTPPGVISGEISLTSNHPQAERLKIPVDCTVLSSD